MTAVSEASTAPDGPAADAHLPRDPVSRLAALFDEGTLSLLTATAIEGSGAVETVAAILALRDRVAPPTVNLDDLDDEVTIDVATARRPLTPRVEGAPMAALVNAFGFGGHNVALVFTEYIPLATEA